MTGQLDARAQLGKPESFDQVLDTAIESGADALCFGCMALNDHAYRLSEALSNIHPGTLVIHPRKAVIRVAELLVEMGLSHSKRSYPTTIKEVSFPS